MGIAVNIGGTTVDMIFFKPRSMHQEEQKKNIEKEHFTENIENKTQNNKNQNTKSNIANIDDGKNKDTENIESCDEKVESKTKNEKNKKTKIKKDEINDSQIENAE